MKLHHQELAIRGRESEQRRCSHCATSGPVAVVVECGEGTRASVCGWVWWANERDRSGGGGTLREERFAAKLFVRFGTSARCSPLFLAYCVTRSCCCCCCIAALPSLASQNTTPQPPQHKTERTTRHHSPRHHHHVEDCSCPLQLPRPTRWRRGLRRSRHFLAPTATPLGCVCFAAWRASDDRCSERASAQCAIRRARWHPPRSAAYRG